MNRFGTLVYDRLPPAQAHERMDDKGSSCSLTLLHDIVNV